MKVLQLFYEEISTQSFSCKICKCSKNTVFTKQLQWLLLGLTRTFKEVQTKNRCDCQRQIPYSSCKNVFAATKNQKQPPQVFCKRRSATLLLEGGSIIGKLLRVLILKNICERLLLKISISVTNSEAIAQRCSVKEVFLEISQNSQ